MRINDARLDQLVVWIYYYLGITDGMSASLEFLKTQNPEPFTDTDWRTTLRSFLPPELAALRQPHAPIEPAIKLIEQTFTEIRNTLPTKLRTTQKTTKNKDFA